MALIIKVQVNDHPIFTVAAQRMTNTKRVTPDSVSEYEITSYTNDPYFHRNLSERKHGRVTHRYGDGANALAQKALHAAQA